MESIVAIVIFLLFPLLKRLLSGEREIAPARPQRQGRKDAGRLSPEHRQRFAPAGKQKDFNDFSRGTDMSLVERVADIPEEKAALETVILEGEEEVEAPDVDAAFKLDRSTVVAGVIMSELLGEPRARRRSPLRRRPI